VSRVPIRLRLAALVALAMMVVLAGAGLFVYLRLADDLDESVDSALEARLAAVVRSGEVAAGSAGDAEDGFAQLLSADGRVLARTGGSAAAGLTRRELSRAAAGEAVEAERQVAGVDGTARLLAGARGEDVAVVGQSLDDRDETLAALAGACAIGAPVAALVVALLGYALAATGLRPVERMRRRAAELTGEAEGRLPVPPSRDEIARLGNTLNAMLGRLQAVLARERSFVSDASHELRTPLAILRTELELALRGHSTRDELEEAVRSAAEETERLNELADDLLVIARSDQGRLPVRPAEIEARALLESVAHRFAARARAEQRTLLAEPADGLTLTADRARLEQALANMVDNALRHGDGDVVLSAARDDGLIELHVRDRGPGFPDDFLPSAFERFSRADEARSRGGTGLGLAITSAVAKAHGGAAHASNREEGGADVWLEIPHPFSSSTHRDWGT